MPKKPKAYVMFNQRQKEAYLDQEKMNKTAVANYFIRLLEKEKEYNKDVADMDIDELEDTIVSLGIRRDESRGHLISLLRGYIKWAILNQLTQNTNAAIDKITSENTASPRIIRETMIKDPDHLREMLDNIMDCVNYENRSIRDSLIFWLLYSGLELDEILLLKKTSLDKATKTVIMEDGKQYEVFDDVLDLWDKCSQITYLEKRNGRSQISKNKKAEEYTKYNLEDSDYLFRPIVRDDYNPTHRCSLYTLRNIIAHTFKDTKRNIPARNFNYSGKFYRIYLLEKEQGFVTSEVFANKFIKGYGEGHGLPVNIRKWRVDYYNWKLAFGHK